MVPVPDDTALLLLPRCEKCGSPFSSFHRQRERSLVEASLQATGMKIERLSQNDIFLEVKRALNPLLKDTRPFLPPRLSLVYESARSQMAGVNIEDELDDYLKIGGLLYSFISLKDLHTEFKCRVPLCLHGTDELPDSLFMECINNGVSKVGSNFSHCYNFISKLYWRGLGWE